MNCLLCGSSNIKAVDTIVSDDPLKVTKFKPKYGESISELYRMHRGEMMKKKIGILLMAAVLMLISAFAGRAFVLKAYEQAVKERYRFFSFGDAMMINRRG